MTSTAFTFPHDPLTPLDPNSPPTAFTVRLLCQELYANAQSVDSILGGGAHGHLGMVMPDYDYVVMANDAEPYDFPEKPDIPVYAGTAANRDQQKEGYKESLDAYNEARHLQNQLRKLMIQAIPKIYIAELAHIQLGYADVTPKAMLDHLLTTYGTITQKHLEENLKKIKTTWNPDTPIELVFANGNECRQLAIEGQEPISDGAYIRILVNIFRDSGVLDKAVEDWELKRNNVKTLANAKVHFTNADNFRRESKAYLKDILAANAATATPSRTRAPPTETTNRTPSRPDSSLEGWFYCWSHGVATHSGTDCLYPAEGHIPTATLKNRQGGKVTIQLGRHRDRDRPRQPNRPQTQPKKRKTTGDQAQNTQGER